MGVEDKYETVIQVKDTNQELQDVESLTYDIVKEGGGAYKYIVKYVIDGTNIETERRMAKGDFLTYFGGMYADNLRVLLLGKEINLVEGERYRAYQDRRTKHYNEEEFRIFRDGTSLMNFTGQRYLFNLSNITLLRDYVEEVKSNNGEDSEVFQELLKDINTKTVTELIVKYVNNHELRDELDIEYDKLKEELSSDYTGNETQISILKLYSKRYESTPLKELSLIEEVSQIQTEGKKVDVVQQISEGDSSRVYHLPVKSKSISFEFSGELLRANREGDRDLERGMLNRVWDGTYGEFKESIEEGIKGVVENGGQVLDMRYIYPRRRRNRNDVFEDMRLHIFYTEDTRVIDFYNKVLYKDTVGKEKPYGSVDLELRYQKFVSIFVKKKGRTALLSGGQPMLTSRLVSDRLSYRREFENCVSYTKEELNELLIQSLDIEFSKVDEAEGKNVLDMENMFNITSDYKSRYGLFRSFVQYRGEYGGNIGGLFDNLQENYSKLGKSLHEMYFNYELNLEANNGIQAYFRKRRR